MPKLPRITADVAKRAFERAGFSQIRQSGSHCILAKPGHPRLLSVPLHRGKTLGPGLLKSLIDSAGLTIEEFCRLI
jgi:predicted RNA binding protein YcfA (HicA-like mRNA interferase family)